MKRAERKRGETDRERERKREGWGEIEVWRKNLAEFDKAIDESTIIVSETENLAHKR